MNVKVILKDGTEVTLAKWQEIYGIANEHIGRNFQLTEARFKTDLAMYGELVVNELLMRVLDSFRESVGVPVTINSFNRSEAKQEELREAGYKTAKVSPHVAKMAADIDTNTVEQTRDWAKRLKVVGKLLGIKVRVGSEQYIKAGMSFVHVDVCAEFYAPGKPFHGTPHPIQWEKEISW